MIDFQPITGHEPLVARARIRFKDVKTGKWIEGISEPQIDPNHMRLWLNVKAYAPCKRHPTGFRLDGEKCKCRRQLTGERDGPTNLITNQFPAFVHSQIFAITPNTNPKRLSDGAATAISGANSLPKIRAGTTNTAAAVTQTALAAETETATATINANPTTGTTSGTFTITGTITAGADRAYVECGFTMQNNGNEYLMCRDVFAVLNVANTGTLAVTYTWTNS